MEIITSKDNRQLKLVRALQLKKHREKEGLFVAEGLRLAEEAALAADCSFALFAADSVEAGNRCQALLEQLQSRSVPCYFTTSALFRTAAATDHPQGVLTVCRIPQLTPPTTGRWFAYCDGVADPGNLGAILRSAYAAGCGGVLLSPDTADLWNPKTVRASMGAIFRLPLWRADSAEAALRVMNGLGVVPLVTAMHGQDIRECAAQLAAPHCWVLGAEANGVSPFWLQQAGAKAVSLPMREGAESLNVGCAAAVLFYQSFFAGSFLPF